MRFILLFALSFIVGCSYMMDFQPKPRPQKNLLTPQDIVGPINRRSLDQYQCTEGTLVCSATSDKFWCTCSRGK